MLQNYWALLVEDDAHDLLAISSLLKEQGIRFKRNTTGAGVFDQLQGMYPRPDVVLVDSTLPDGNAFQICRDLQQSVFTAQIPLILLADALDDNLIHCAQEAGFVAALSKPLPRARFGPLLERILQGDHTFTHTFCPA